MQIDNEAIVAGANGYVFNCDGQYALPNTPVTGYGDVSKVNSVYANYTKNVSYNEKPVPYGAHTQFAQVLAGPEKPNPNANGALNAKTDEQTSADCLTVYPVSVADSLKFSDHFAGGPGEIHIYGEQTPFDLIS